MISNTKHDRDSILREVVSILEDMTSDWDIAFDEGVARDTRLIADLEFESIDVVQLIVAIEEKFQRRDLPFEKLLMQDGRYVDEIRVADAVDFLHEHLSGAAA
jgi:acyl carrier protein